MRDFYVYTPPMYEIDDVVDVIFQDIVAVYQKTGTEMLIKFYWRI